MIKNLKFQAVFTFCVILFAFSCKKDKMVDYNILSNLPVDNGGINTSNPLGSNAAPYGYYIYTPSETDPEYPLIVFLHGSGEKGNSSNDPTILDMVLRNGPSRLIKDKKWHPTYPVVVVSPQCHDDKWNPAKIHALIKYIIDNYSINTKRIYVTGLSMGGYGTFSYLTTTADSCFAAAAVPICGGGNTSQVSKMKHIPLWAFHGDADLTVLPSKSIEMVNAINALNPAVRAKLTMYPGIGHDSWTKTYNGTGMGTERADYDAFNMQIYDWMFQYEWHQFLK
jgi:predicted peptidase